MEILLIINFVLAILLIKNKIAQYRLIDLNERLNAHNQALANKVADQIGTISAMRQYPN